MPAATVIKSAAAASLTFGVGASDEASLITHGIKVTRKAKQKFAADRYGSTIAVAFYDPSVEVNIEGLATTTLTVGSAMTLANAATISVTGTLLVEEISEDRSNEDFVKTTIKATAFATLTAV